MSVGAGRPVYLAAPALLSTCGNSAAASAAAILAGGRAPAQQTVGERSFPYFPLPLSGDSWAFRAAQAFAALRAQLPALPAATPLFFASSSFQIGEFESASDELPPACAAFARRAQAWLGLDGPCHAVANACISGFSALAEAAALIAGGYFDSALVVGCELANASTLAGFAGMGLLSSSVPRPFALERDGLVLGEAVAAVVVTACPTPWRLAATASGLDAYSPTGPEPDGGPIAAVMRHCLASAGWAPASVGLVKVQAAGSPGADLAEARALQQVFAAMPPLVSLKPWLGHTLGASGVAELAALLALYAAGSLPAAAAATPDPEIPLQLLEAPLAAPVTRSLLNLIGFGGGLASLALEHCR